MTVASETPKNQYTAGGSTTVFAYTFRIEDESELTVYEDETEVTSGFTVSGVGVNGGGSVTYSTAPTNGTVITLLRKMPTTRVIDYQNSGAFRSNTVDEDLDRVWLKLQQIETQINIRALQFTETTSRAASDNTLPNFGDYVGEYLTVGPGGVITTATGGTGDSGLRTDLAIDDDTAKGAALVGYRNGTVQSKLDLFVTPIDFGATGDGSTDDTTACQLWITYAETNGVIALVAGGNFKVTSPLQITAPVVIQGDGISELHYYDTDARITNNAFVGPAIFQYIDDDYPNGGIDGVTIDNVIARGMESVSNEHYLFCSLGYSGGSLITGQTTARTDRFRFTNNKCFDMCGYMTYGRDLQAYGNWAYNSNALGLNYVGGTDALETDRHYAYAHNHFINENDDTYDDTSRSDCNIHDNYAFGFAGGVLVHSYFDLTDNTRRVIERALVHDNFCIGGDENAVLPSRAPIYLASVIRADVHDNYCWYGNDVGIDLENCGYGKVVDNFLYNCCLAQFWDTEVTEFRNNVVVIGDQSYYDTYSFPNNFFRKTGSQSTGKIILNDNIFICSLSGADRIGKITNTIATAELEIKGNKILNGIVVSNTDVPKVKTITSDNEFYFDKVIGAFPVMDLWITGDCEIEDNKIISQTVVSDAITRLAQTTAFAAIEVTMNRYTDSIDAKKAKIKRNEIYGWVNSFEFNDQGSSSQRWNIELVDNEYDGYIIAETPSTTSSRIYIKENKMVQDVDDASAGMFAAYPTNTTEAGQLGSTTGTHDGASDSATLSDSGAAWTINAFVGLTVINTTDGSRGVITANTATTITATLAGGTDNDWDASDAYRITNTAAGIEFRGGSEITLYGAQLTGTGNPYKYIMGVESAQTWSTLNLP